MMEYPSRGHFAFVGDTPVLYEPGPSSIHVWHSYYTVSSIPYTHVDYYDLLEWSMNQAAENMRVARRALMAHLSSIVDTRYKIDLMVFESWDSIIKDYTEMSPRQKYRETMLDEFREVMAEVQSRLEGLGYMWLRHQRPYVSEPLLDYLRNNGVIIKHPLSVFDMIVTSIERNIDANNDTKG